MAYDLTPYMPMIKQAANKYGVSEEQIIATIKRESSGNPGARNGSHFGLMQVSPAVFAEAGYKDKSQFHDPAVNIDAGARYLGQQKKAFGGDPLLAQAAYVVGAQGLRDMQAGKRPWDPQLNGYLDNPLFQNVWDNKNALTSVGFKGAPSNVKSINNITGLPAQPVAQEDQTYAAQGAPVEPEMYSPEWVRREQERFALMGQKPEYYGVDPTEEGEPDYQDGIIMGLEGLLSAFANKDHQERTVEGRITGGGQSGWGRNASLAIKQGQAFGSPSLYK